MPIIAIAIGCFVVFEASGFHYSLILTHCFLLIFSGFVIINRSHDIKRPWIFLVKAIFPIVGPIFIIYDIYGKSRLRSDKNG